MATPEGTLFRDLAVVLLAAGATALLFHRLRQPAVLGYLLAGFLVGPFSPGPSFVGDTEVMSFLGELGIVFLLFALGLEFSLRKLRAVGVTAILAGVLEVTLMLWLGYSLGRLFGWQHLESLFLGSIMAISSTTIIVKVLEEKGLKGQDWAQIAFGILIIEDIVAVLILTMLSSASATGNFQPELLTSLAYKLVVFLGAAAVLGVMLAPRLVERLERVNDGIAVVVAVGFGFGLALLAAEFGFSAGLGAFVAGALLAESPRVARIEHLVAPLRDVFTAIFFVTIGALLDPAVLRDEWLLVIAVTVGVIVGKTAAVSFATFAAGVPPGKSLRVGMTMSQIGEFSFVIAALGVTLAVTRPGIVPIAVAVSTITAFLTPQFVSLAPRATSALAQRVPAGVRAYAGIYDSWVKRLRASDRGSAEWAEVRSMAVRATLMITVIVALFGAAIALIDDLLLALPGSPGNTGLLRMAAWIGVSIIAAPFAIGWYVALRRLINALAHAAVPQRLRKATPTPAERLLKRTFGLLAMLLTGSFTLAIASPFVPPLFVLTVVLIGVGISTAFLGRSLTRFHDQVERTVDRVVQGSPQDADSRETALAAISGSQAWGAASREITLPTVSGGTGRTLGDLRLRALTGASVVSVRRHAEAGHEATTLNPGAQHRLHDGDHILLVGDEESLTRAAEILLGRDLGVDGGATEIPVPPDSPLVGVTLGSARIPERTGADVLVVRRGEDPLMARGDLTLRAGDVLVVSGTDEQVAMVRDVVARPSYP